MFGVRNKTCLSPASTRVLYCCRQNYCEHDWSWQVYG